MKAFAYGILINWKMNLRDKEMLIFYYLVPLIFYLFVGMVFTSIIPDYGKTLMQVMTIFGITMGGVLGSPYLLVEIFGTDIKKAYQVGKVPFWTIAAGNFISALLHLFLMSLIIYFTAPIIFETARPEHPGIYFLGLLMTIIASLSIGMAFGLFIKSSSKLGMATQFVFMPSILLSGLMFPASMLPGFLRMAGKILPATWGMEVMCADHLEFSSFGALGIIIILFLVLSAWKLKRLAKA